MKKYSLLIALVVGFFAFQTTALAALGDKWSVGVFGSEVRILNDGDVLFEQTGGTTSDADFEVDGYAVFDGTVEFNSTIQLDGVVTLNSGLMKKHVLDDDDVTLVLADCGSVRMIATDAKTYTLPDTTTVGAGCEYTFVNTGADDAVLLTVTPDDTTADGIYGTIAAVSMTGTDDGDLTNTKSGANQGDWAKIVSDGVTGWFIIGGDGVWAGA